MSGLKREVARLSEILRNQGIGHRIILESDAGVGITVVKDAANKRFQLLYMQPDDYPHTGVIVTTDDPDCETVALNAIDAHEERSALGDVFVTLCDAMSAEVPQSLLCLGPSHSSGGANDGGCSDGTAAMDEDSAGNGALDGDSDDDPSHSSDAFDMAERDDTATTVKLYQKVGRWQAFEDTMNPPAEEAPEGQTDKDVLAAQDALEEAAAAQNAAMTAEEKQAARNQLFEPKAAYTMISGELKKAAGGHFPWLDADAIGDDVYKWDVRITQCTPGTPLAQDLEQLRRTTGDGSVRLRMSFKRGLHPFYPAAVQVVAPRFQGPLAGAVASHPLLQMHQWDPTRSTDRLLALLRHFMETSGRVDQEASVVAAAEGRGAYSEEESLLARMEALTATPPACAAQWASMYSA
eukprot:CAMPEP_0206141010 /NCGR_PEP_ID=MMETSP1473-20131121/11513_1 /ASSEMBLY_ACC=CAM_ASM_001109 /TAXON_ID=1461547 /ORGANISM="Stichococcus sp, Strain RCC1054" /LENGTH=407 /DNA_ID=CAMNT_0053535399 /DNA_START=79 /DNA_END=1299 /DNA_ORIENTATION=+